jgi:hypothetical protein
MPLLLETTFAKRVSVDSEGSKGLPRRMPKEASRSHQQWLRSRLYRISHRKKENLKGLVRGMAPSLVVEKVHWKVKKMLPGMEAQKAAAMAKRSVVQMVVYLGFWKAAPWGLHSGHH